MAKGQNKRGREAKKPKQVKGASLEAPSFAKGLTSTAKTPAKKA